MWKFLIEHVASACESCSQRRKYFLGSFSVEEEVGIRDWWDWLAVESTSGIGIS